MAEFSKYCRPPHGPGGYFTALLGHLPRHQEISVWQDTYPPLHLQRAGGHLGQSEIEESGRAQEVWRESALLQPVHKSPEDLTLHVRSGYVTITFLPTLSLHRSVSFISSICNGGEDNAVWEI